MNDVEMLPLQGAQPIHTPQASPAKVLDFQAFKMKKVLLDGRSSGVNQAFRAANESPRSVLGNEVSGSESDLVSRIERIKSSIDRINRLMAELKSISNSPNPSSDK